MFIGVREMSQNIAARNLRIPGAPAETTQATRRLLACGAVAGPLFIIVAFIQVFTRGGFNPVRHPLSLLSLGDLGWIQIANFVIGGVLFAISASGMKQVLQPGVGGRWGPWLIRIFGLSLIAGGVFLADPAFGFPPGTPDGAPARLSWHGIVHAFAPAIGFSALIAACFVLGRRFGVAGDPRWAVYSYVTGPVVFILSNWSTFTMNFVPLWIALVLGFGWASAICARLMAGLHTLN